MILCASGAIRPPRRASLERLQERLARPDGFTGAIAGARIEARGERALFCREAGERARGAMAEADLPLGESIFDGRFLVTASAAGGRIAALRGLARRLPRDATRAPGRDPRRCPRRPAGGDLSE